jgi:hypothetical protein
MSAARVVGQFESRLPSGPVTTWEYMTAYASAKHVGGPPGKAVADAEEKWRIQLNARGAEGWELVSERFVFDSPASGQWAQYSGTMKRPISSE